METTPPDLLEIRTTFADGGRASVMVPANVAPTALRLALGKAWRAKNGDVVEVFSPR